MMKIARQHANMASTRRHTGSLFEPRLIFIDSSIRAPWFRILVGTGVSALFRWHFSPNGAPRVWLFYLKFRGYAQLMLTGAHAAPSVTPCGRRAQNGKAQRVTRTRCAPLVAVPWLS